MRPQQRRVEGEDYNLPFTIALVIASVIPILLMVRKADVLTFKVIHSPVSGIKNLFTCKFGLNLRLVLALEWLTLLPTIEVFPVKSQILDMTLFFSGRQMYIKKELGNVNILILIIIGVLSFPHCPIFDN